LCQFINKKGKTLDLQALPYILFLGFLYGTTLVVSRFSVGQFEPTTYIGLRLAMSSLGFIVIYTLRIKKRHWPKNPRLWGHAAILGVFGSALPMTAFVSSLQYQSSGVTSILITASPAITVLMAHFTLHDERLNLRKIAGIVLALGGALLLIVRGESGLPDMTQANPIGYGLVLLGMLATGTMRIYIRKHMTNFSAFNVGAVRMFAASITIIPISFLTVGFDLSRTNTQGWLALLYAALFGTFVAMLFDFYNTKRFGATASVMVSYVIPVFAGIVGALFLDERITGGMLFGMALISLGVWLINKR
jgi:drug/metabolite transporter (DMT)-like permease